MSREEITEKSARIAACLYSLDLYTQSGAVMFFISFGSEVQTRPMVEETISRGKLALAPKALPESRELLVSRLLDWDRDLLPGAYNIPEPREESFRQCDPGVIDLLIVPGVAFDRKGNRLGYGGGYYDRFFERLRPGTPLVALAFNLQVIPVVPVEKWDRPVDLILTETGIINPGRDKNN